MRYYTQRYRFPSKTANLNQKKNTVLKCQKKFLFQKIDKNVQIDYLFLGNS